MDPSANDQAKQCIRAKNSEADVLIIATSEETTIARHCSAKLSES
jgi:acetate kinase